MKIVPFSQAKFAAWLVVALGFLSSAVHAEPPSLTHVVPGGGQRGTKVMVTCAGKFPAWPVSISSPGVEAVAGSDSGKVEITIPADLAADRVWLRLYNAEGASNAVPFLIGSLKEIEEQEPNNLPRAAQALTETSVTINGVLNGADVDGFALTLAPGQTVVADLDANNQLGSPMDAVLQIATPDGVVVAENHDDVELDPRLAFTAKRAGTYVVRVFAFSSTPNTSIAFQGGANYVYRLTVTTGPFISHSVPAAAAKANPGEVDVFGWNIPPRTKLPVAIVPDNLEWETLADVRGSSDSRLGLVFAAGMGGSARVRLVPWSVATGLAQGTAENPFLLALPITITGRLMQPKQTDVFRIPLKKGEPVLIAAETRSMESAVQPVLRLVDPTGAAVVSVDDAAPTRAKVMSATAAADGDYRLTVHDRFDQAGELNFYRLTVRLEEPDFELTMGADAIVVAPEKPAELVINVQRRATVGPITIEALDLPPGVTAAAAVSEPTGETAAKVTLKFSTTGPAFSGPVRIQGSSKEPGEMTRLARTPAQLGASFGNCWLTVIAAP